MRRVPDRSPGSSRRGRGWKVAGAGTPRSSASWSRTRTMIRSVVSRSSSALSGRPSRTCGPLGGQVDRLADQVLGRRAEAQPELLAVVVVHLLRAPLGHREDDGVGGQGQPGDPGAGLHRPPVRIAGDRPLGIDHDDVAGVQVGLRRVQRLVRLGREPRHRDLAGAAQQRAREALEHRLLGQEVRQPAVVEHQPRAGQRIEDRDVVGDQEHRARAAAAARRAGTAAGTSARTRGGRPRSRRASRRTAGRGCATSPDGLSVPADRRSTARPVPRRPRTSAPSPARLPSSL